MSLKYRNGAGVETPVAGLNGTSGELVPSATYYQEGRETISSIAANSVANETVTFQTAMPDTEYVVAFSTDPATGNGKGSISFALYSRSASGFSVNVRNNHSEAATDVVCHWQAFKLITQEEIALDEQAITDIQEVIPSTATTANKLVTQSELTAAISDAINNLSALIYG